MKLLSLALASALVLSASVSMADAGDSSDRSEILAVAASRSNHAIPRKLKINLVSDASGCSNAGDQTARPVYTTIDGTLVLVGYECVQDNRGQNGG